MKDCNTSPREGSKKKHKEPSKRVLTYAFILSGLIECGCGDKPDVHNTKDGGINIKSLTHPIVHIQLYNNGRILLMYRKKSKMLKLNAVKEFLKIWSIEQ